MKNSKSSVRLVFDEVFELQAIDRRAQLDRLCENQPELRSAVEKLLDAHDNANHLLDMPMGYSELANPPLQFQTGDHCGEYELLDKIGDGGFGHVFAAKSPSSLGRNLALKIIKPGMDSAQVLARFETERQSLAFMDHPHIARFIDSGVTGSGYPYFVMELVSGQTITKHCRERQLSVRQRVSLIISVCHAIQHAHQKGIIHRDLKPSNIMVGESDGKPIPKVIDFGVAKATKESQVNSIIDTRQFEVIGTPLYMSPEQAGLSRDIDVRTDVYSLGVILYELMTGCSPIDEETARSKGTDEIRRMIQEVTPARPSRKVATSTGESIANSFGVSRQRLCRSLKRDLDWIVMKAIEKDRARRYESVADLGRDLQRWLLEEPVEARPPTIGYVTYCFLKRNLVASVAASIVALTLIAATLFSLNQTRIAKSSEASYRAVLNNLQSLMLSGAPMAGGLGAKATVLDMATHGIDSIAEDLPDQPHARAVMYFAIGEVLYKLGDRKTSVRPLEEAVSTYESLGQGRTAEALGAKALLARAVQITGDTKMARDLADEVLTIAPNNEAYSNARIEANYVLARLERDNAQNDRAVQYYRVALELAQKYAHHTHEETCLQQLYAVLKHSDSTEAMKYARQSFDLALARNTKDYEIAWANYSWATANTDFGNHTEVIAALEPNLENLANALGESNRSVVHAKAILGVAYAKEGRQEEAIAKLDEAWQVINSEGFEDVPLKAYVSVMRTKYRVPPGGECDCSDDQDSLIEVLAKPHVSNRDVVNARMALAICYRRSAARNVQNPDEFFRLMNLACEHTRHVYESYGNDSTRFKAAATHATMLRDARRFEEAVDFIETNLPLAPDNHVGRLELELAGAQIGLGNIEEGLTLIQSGKAKMPAELEHRTQGYLFACGVALQNQAFFKEAHALFEEAIERASVKSTSVPKDTKQMFYERAASSALAHAKAKPSAESTDFLRLALETAESRYAESKTQGTLSKKREGNFSQLIAQIYVALDDHEAATVWNEVSQREKLDKQK